MPLRVYKCEDPGCSNNKPFEHIHTKVNERLTACPICGKSLLALLTTPNFKFSGPGFYSVDYRPKQKKEDAK
jgi:predicted nucleic acid-binding Zn ribbon protein